MQTITNLTGMYNKEAYEAKKRQDPDVHRKRVFALRYKVRTGTFTVKLPIVIFVGQNLLKKVLVVRYKTIRIYLDIQEVFCVKLVTLSWVTWKVWLMRVKLPFLWVNSLTT
jgi:hypothetical protein